MSLRSRTFLVAAASFLLAGGALLYAVRSITLEGFHEIETRAALADGSRVMAAIDHDLAGVRTHAVDYAEWDDTFEFVHGRKPDYFPSGLTESTFKAQRIDAIAITDAADRLVFAKSYDAESGEFGDLPASLAALGPGHPLLLHHRKEKGEIAGCWLDPAGPMALCALPVTKSDGEGEFGGTLVFARFLDADEVQRLCERTRTAMSLAVGGASLPARPAPAGEAAPEPVFLGEAARDALSVYGTLAFLNSPEPLVVRVDLGRPAVEAAERVFRLILVSGAILGAVTLGVVLLLLNRLVLMPLDRMGGAVNEIARSGRTDRPVPAEGEDEFAALARHFNEMLATIESSRVALAAAVAEANRANRAKSAFLASMSHEIRTTMNGVLGMIEMALDRASDAEQKEMLTTAKGAAEAQLALLNDILDLSKVEAGKLELEKAPFALGETIRESVQAFRWRAKEKGLALEVRYDDAVPAWVAGDALRLRQVVTNLVANALKFTEKGSIVATASAAPAGADGRVAVRVEVRDTGIGIPADRVARIFEEFGQADSSVARRFGGTGLGLTISARLVALMGGKLEVHSEPGKGSVLHFTIPLEPAAAPPTVASPKAAYATPARILRILVAEDDLVNQRVARYFLERRGHSVVLAGDGREAVRMVAAGGLDLVLMDMHMPEMDGVEAARAIRSAEPSSRHIPIVALTASAMREDFQTCLDAGMDSCLSKPVRAETLVWAVESPFVSGTAA